MGLEFACLPVACPEKLKEVFVSFIKNKLETPRMTDQFLRKPEHLDQLDDDVDTHIDLFLTNLAAKLRLERVLALDINRPKETLATLLEVRKAIEVEKLKADALFKLKTNSPPEKVYL